MIKRILIFIVFLISVISLFSQDNSKLPRRLIIFNKVGQKEIIRNNDNVSIVIGPDIKPEYTYLAYLPGNNSNEYVVVLKSNENLFKEISILRNSVDSVKSIKQNQAQDIQSPSSKDNPIQKRIVPISTDTDRTSSSILKPKSTAPQNLTIFNLKNHSEDVSGLKDNINLSRSKIDMNNDIIDRNRKHIDTVKAKIEDLKLSGKNLEQIKIFEQEIDSLLKHNNKLLNENKGLITNKEALENELKIKEISYEYLLKVMVFLSVILLLVLLLAIIIYRNNLQKKKFNRDLQKINDQIHSQNEQLLVLNLQKEKLLNQIDKELKRASQYVLSILPKPFTNDRLSVDWLMITCLDLGGDTFGYKWISDDVFSFFLLDVSGHGVGPALHSVQVQNILQNQSIANINFEEPGEVLNSLNHLFQMRDHNDMYFTMCYGIIDFKTKKFRYSTAGHPPFIVSIGKSDTQLLQCPNIFIGATDKFKFVQNEIDLKSPTSIYFFTDGVYEIFNEQNEMLTYDRFKDELIKRCEKEDGHLQKIYDFAIEFTGTESLDDDFSILKISIK